MVNPAMGKGVTTRKIKGMRISFFYIGILVLHCYYKTKRPNFSKKLTLMLILDIFFGESVCLFS